MSKSIKLKNNVYLDSSSIIHKRKLLSDILYPVGAIYLSTNNINPSTLFGGTWEQIKDRFLLACGDSYSNGATGGEFNHKLTVDEMPSHNHNMLIPNATGPTSIDGYGVYDYVNPPFNTWGALFDVGYRGGDKAHNNMPPYLAVYMWKRTA